MEDTNIAKLETNHFKSVQRLGFGPRLLRCCPRRDGGPCHVVGVGDGRTGVGSLGDARRGRWASGSQGTRAAAGGRRGRKGTQRRAGVGVAGERALRPVSVGVAGGGRWVSGSGSRVVARQLVGAGVAGVRGRGQALRARGYAAAAAFAEGAGIRQRSGIWTRVGVIYFLILHGQCCPRHGAERRELKKIFSSLGEHCGS
jgi:hypothetical protein